MTVGQRIAQKRKELGLSQEGLGEQLGVSRQAIYKWESEASPGELTESQLAMVREIVDRYLAAQPKPAPTRRRWKVLAALAMIALVVCLFNLFTKLDQVSQDYNNLYWSVDSISRNVNSQIGSITTRVEDILKSQNDLTAEWSAQLVSTDLRANTATFAVRVVPKAYAEGMTAAFMMYSGGETVEAPAQSGAGHSFSGEITCPLSDEISLSVVLLSDGTGETQLLADYYDLYTQSFPELTVSGVWRTGSNRNILLPTDRSTAAIVESGDGEVWTPAPPASIRVGLFRDQKLLLWYEPGVRYLDAIDREVPGWNLPELVKLEPDHEYCVAALYTDEYGRQRIYQGYSTTYNSDPTSASAAAVTPGWGEDPDEWEF